MLFTAENRGGNGVMEASFVAYATPTRAKDRRAAAPKAFTA
jgi:hypothetical protein